MKKISYIGLLFCVYASQVCAVNDSWLGRQHIVSASFDLIGITPTSPPKPKALIMPAYPFEFVDSGVQGCVVVEFIVLEDGKVDQVSVVNADFKELGVESKRVVENWKFEAALNRKDEKPVAAKMRCRFEFRFREKE